MTNFSRVILWPLLTLVASACVTQRMCVAPPSPNSKLLQRTTLIPQGTHQHSVLLKMKQGKIGGHEKMAFSGVLDFRGTNVQVVGLSPFGSTLFKLTDNLLTGETTFTSDNVEMKKAEPFIKTYYAPIRKMLFVPYPPRLENTEQSGTKFHFSDYDGNDVPRKIEVETETFDLSIRVESYEP